MRNQNLQHVVHRLFQQIFFGRKKRNVFECLTRLEKGGGRRCMSSLIL